MAISSKWPIRHHGSTSQPNAISLRCGATIERWAAGRMIYTNTEVVLPDVIEQLTDAMRDDPKIVDVLLMCTDATARKRLCQRETG